MYNCRQQAILTFIKAKKSANRSEIQQYIMEQFNNSSKITVLRDLNLLINESLVVKSGKTKAALYSIYPSSTLTEDINVDNYFNIDSDKRKLKSEKFNFDIWASKQSSY
jgi:arginine repressor